MKSTQWDNENRDWDEVVTVEHSETILSRDRRTSVKDPRQETGRSEGLSKDRCDWPAGAADSVGGGASGD